MFALSRDLRDLYQEVILDHNRRPRNFGALADADRAAEATTRCAATRSRSLCGSTTATRRGVAFEGAGCAISMASASLMTEVVKGKTEAEVEALFRRFHELVTGIRAAAPGADDQCSASWRSSPACASSRCASSARPWPGTRCARR